MAALVFGQLFETFPLTQEKVISLKEHGISVLQEQKGVIMYLNDTHLDLKGTTALASNVFMGDLPNKIVNFSTAIVSAIGHSTLIQPSWIYVAGGV